MNPRPLQGWQQRGLARAQANGNETRYLANHPGVLTHQVKTFQQGQQPPGAAQTAANMLQRQATTSLGASKPGIGPASTQTGIQQTQNPNMGGAIGPAKAPTGNAATGSSKAGGAAPPAQGGGIQGGMVGGPMPPPGQQPPATAPTFTQDLNSNFGQGNPFGMQDWYGRNPLQTATQLANRNLGENLANLNSRYAGSGLGNSSYLGQAQGQAIGNMNAQLGDTIAERGIAAQQGDANRALQAILGARGQMLQGRGLDMQNANQLAQLGNLINAIGVNEQGIPNIEALLALLGFGSRTSTSGSGSSRGQETTGFLGA